MFYVSGAKIYLATFDAELKVYPEVKLAWIDYDHLGVVKTGKGVTKKPVGCKLCSMTEVLAQFGGRVAPVTSDESYESEENKTKGSKKD